MDLCSALCRRWSCFILLVAAYGFLVRRPLDRVLAERRARTTGAVEQARGAIATAEAETTAYEEKLRAAKAEIFQARDQKLKQWNAEREAALAQVRQHTQERVRGGAAGDRAERPGGAAPDRRDERRSERADPEGGTAGRRPSDGGGPVRSLRYEEVFCPAVVMAALLFAPVAHASAQEHDPQPLMADSLSYARGAVAREEQAGGGRERRVPPLAVGAQARRDARLERRAGGHGLHRRELLVLAVLVGWFLLKTLPKTFRDRTTAIQKDLVDARTATEEASARLSSVEERLSKLDEQIAAMRAQAEKDSALDEQRIKASVEEDKQKILAAAEQEIAAATALAQRQIQQYAAELAIDQAARKLVVTAETDRLLVQSFARRLMGDDSKEGHN